VEASIVDLRYKSKDILAALDRNESVTILYHGKVKGVITPAKKKAQLSIDQHPFFGMKKSSKQSVLDEMKQLRKLRHAL
jgi:hypothetical protein